MPCNQVLRALKQT